jgi:small subunit ribosomal protein S8
MSNYNLGDLISRIKNALKGHLKSIRVLNTKMSIDILIIFYKIGLIRGFKVSLNYIEIFLKYYKNKPVIFKIKLISKPSKKVY